MKQKHERQFCFWLSAIVETCSHPDIVDVEAQYADNCMQAVIVMKLRAHVDAEYTADAIFKVWGGGV